MFPSCLPFLSLFEHCGFGKSSLITEPSASAHQEGLNVPLRMYICITPGGIMKWDLRKKSNTLCMVTASVWYRQLPLLQSQGENSSVEQWTELGNKGSKGNLKHLSSHLWLWIFLCLWLWALSSWWTNICRLRRKLRKSAFLNLNKW